MLKYHWGALKTAVPNAKIYYVVSTSEENELVELLNGQKNITVVSCDFNRNHNLTGYEAHVGMLKIMQYLSSINNNANVCKIDTDCYFVGADWLKGIGEEYTMVGTACLVNYYCKRNLLLYKQKRIGFNTKTFEQT